MPLILITIGLVLIIYNYRSIKRENEMKQEESSLNISFQSVLQDSKDELNDYKMEIGTLRRDIAESLTELQEEIVEIKNNLNKLKINEKRYENKEYLEIEDSKSNAGNNKEFNEIDGTANTVGQDIIIDPEIDSEVICEVDFSGNIGSIKTENIKRLLKDGLTEEQICHQLSVSKGEVLLVKGLFKK